MKNNLPEKIKILVVDDKPENLSVMFQLLSESYEVLAAEDGAIAIKIVEESCPDLILLDIMMPVMNGYEVLETLKNDQKTANIPVIFMSALSENVDKIKGLRSGASDYITKPFNNEEVLLRIETQVKIIKYRKELVELNLSLDRQVKKRTLALEDKFLELEKANNNLQQSENRYKVLFEDAPDSIVLIDINNGKVVDANPAASNLFGVDRKEIIGKDQREIFQNTEENVQRNISVVNATKTLGRPAQRLFSNLIVRSDGTKTPVESTVRTIFIDGNLYLQGIMRDISERKIVEEQLKIAKNKAEEMNKIKSNFLANISHELRTPLISILGFSQFLVEELQDEELRNMADIVNQGGQRLLNTLNLILDISLIENGKVSINESRLDIKNILEETAQKYKSDIESKGLQFNTRFSDESYPIKADENMLKQIFENLISNALKFTSQGFVNISLAKTTVNDKLYCSITIEDSGIGIHPSDLENIFKEFRQASEGATRNYDGTGLGLTIANRFIEYLGGYIEVKSIPGKGSIFTLFIPIFSDKENDLKSMIKESLEKRNDYTLNYNPGKQKILYVEDDFATREFARFILEKEFQLDTFESSEEALKSLTDNYYDLFLIDVNLGSGLSGLKFVEALNENKLYQKKPKVAVTAFAMRGDREKLLARGFTHYLSKPFERRSLIEMVKSLV